MNNKAVVKMSPTALKESKNEDINAVDFYNRFYLEDAIQLLMTKHKKSLSRTGTNEITESSEDGRTIATIMIRNGMLITEDHSKLIMIDTWYTPFMIMTKVKFKGNHNEAYSWIDRDYLNAGIPYIRVGSDYYKEVTKTDRFDIERTELVRWKKEEIRQDHGPKIFNFVRKYDDFVLRPDNENYEKNVNNSYNMYHPFPHKPKKGEWQWTERLLRHVFGEQYELGLKYLQVLYLHPDKPLPILVLASKIRETGKSTFLDYMSILFGQNMTVITPKDMDSAFNSSYASSNIIGIEETVVGEKSHMTEKLKALSTNKFLSVNRKFIDNYKVPFYGKFIVTTNDEVKFMKIDQDEIRFWVRILGVPKFKNTNINQDLKNEIPAFLAHLKSMEEVDFTKSRMVFTAAEIRTSALKRVVDASKPALYYNLFTLFQEYFENDAGAAEEILATTTDIKREFFYYDNNIDLKYIDYIMTEHFLINKSTKSIWYKPFRDSMAVDRGGELIGYNGPAKARSGRPFEVKKSLFVEEEKKALIEQKL